MEERPFAEDLPYWRTSRTSHDGWIEKLRRLIENTFHGAIDREAFGKSDGRAAFLVEFTVEGERFRICWPVLESRHEDELAARRQAATMMYHDAKARALAAKVFGARFAFFQYLLLGDGRTVGQLADRELALEIPSVLRLKEATDDVQP